MIQYPVDIAADQVVRWLLAEQRAGRLAFEVQATRRYVSEAVTTGLGEDQRPDLGEVVAVGVLEISPLSTAAGWLLRIRMEDPLGPRLPDDEPAPEGEEEIDLDTFQAEFVAPGRALEDVTLEANTPQAKARFTRLLNQLLRDRHAGGSGSASISTR